MTNKTTKLTVQKRELAGRKVKQLRREGIVPANIFGKDIKSQTIQLSEKDFLKAYKEAGETSIIEITIEGAKDNNPVLVSNLQVHPVTGKILHVDFHQVDLKEKVTATVPVELIGESPAVKEKGGVLFATMTELDVTALPTEIPNKIEIDVSVLEEIGDSITLKDLKLDSSKFEFAIDAEEALVLIQEQTTAPEPDEETSDEAEGEKEAGTEESKEGESEAKAKSEEKDSTE